MSPYHGESLCVDFYVQGGSSVTPNIQKSKTKVGYLHYPVKANTACDATACGPNEKVVNHVCTACPPGKTSTGSHDASGDDTTCDATACGENEKVVNHACTPCPAGTTSIGSHDASGADTTCDVTSCGPNEKVVNHVCTTCPPGKTSTGNHDASGAAPPDKEFG